MAEGKANVQYSEPPPPYSCAPVAENLPASAPPYDPNVAAYHNMFQSPAHPPPPGGVPVFPMAPGYYPPPSQTVIINAPSRAQGNVQAVNVVRVHCGLYPMQITCQHCSAPVMSETTALPGLLTWILSLGLIMLGCWAGCCLIPCCAPECQDIEHRCPNCKQHLGTFRRINI